MDKAYQGRLYKPTENLQGRQAIGRHCLEPGQGLNPATYLLQAIQRGLCKSCRPCWVMIKSCTEHTRYRLDSHPTTRGTRAAAKGQCVCDMHCLPSMLSSTFLGDHFAAALATALPRNTYPVHPQELTRIDKPTRVYDTATCQGLLGTHSCTHAFLLLPPLPQEIFDVLHEDYGQATTSNALTK